MKERIFSFLKRYLIAATWVYFTFFFTWMALYLLTGDRFGYLGLINIVAVYFFFPLPLVAVIGVVFRRREAIAGSTLGMLVFLWLWGALFVPRLNSPAEGNPHPTLTVMTYNILALQPETRPAVDVIRAEAADVVFLQEVNLELADALVEALGDMYPYQILNPQPYGYGMGLISRYPIRLPDEELPLVWDGLPQIAELDWEGKRVTLVNFHTIPTGLARPSVVANNFRHREIQALTLADFASWNDGPIILAGDANAVPISDVHRILIRSPLRDAWQEAGFGLGHTFPGSDVPGSSRPRMGSYPVPQWLARVDYIFHSLDWETVSARLAQFDGVSDHRGVVAELVLVGAKP